MRLFSRKPQPHKRENTAIRRNNYWLRVSTRKPLPYCGGQKQNSQEIADCTIYGNRSIRPYNDGLKRRSCSPTPKSSSVKALGGREEIRVYGPVRFPLTILSFAKRFLMHYRGLRRHPPKQIGTPPSSCCNAWLSWSRTSHLPRLCKKRLH